MTVSTELVDLVRQGAEANERPDLVRRLRPSADAGTVVRALRSLEVDLRARRAARCEPGRGARLAAETRHGEKRLRRFEEDAAAWPRLLGEALSAASSDVEYAVQSRMQRLVDDGTAVIAKRDANFEQWLDERLVTEAEASYRTLHEAAAGVAGALRPIVVVRPPSIPLEPPADLVSRLHRRPVPAERTPLAARLLGILMPTYSGMMIALVLPRLFGLRLPLWLIVAAAVTGAFAMGGAAFAAERQRQISRRTSETVGGLRSTVDAFRMAVTKQVRDGLRTVDQQLHAATGEAVGRETRRLAAAAAEANALAEDARDPERAVHEIDADLESVRELLQRATQPEPATQPLMLPQAQQAA
ncbi:hypothetical protein [Actinoplanes sp. NPDC026619]|uniref:hypothetical protein n=1 Tax=Actinoplanes sp. NPDC026619 TaxID=3155798 RepID=UPI0033C0ADBA